MSEGARQTAPEPAPRAKVLGGPADLPDVASEAFELAPTLMGVVEPTDDDDILHVRDNRAASAFFDLGPGGTTQRLASSMGATPETIRLWLGHYRKSAASGQPVRFEYAYAGPGGEEWLLVAVRPVSPGPNGRARFMYVAEDITARKRAEQTAERAKEALFSLMQAMRDADRRKDEFLATLAHELRNPLAPIRNAVQILKMKGPPDPKLVWSHEVIDRQVQHMARLLEDLLDVSRISREKLVLRKERVDLASVIDAAIETSNPLIDAGHHELEVTVPAGSIFVEGDPVRLAQVFSNLLNNAAKYTPDGGKITLTVERRDTRAVVTVQDNGIGITSESLPRVFEIFSQAAPALGRAQGGLGIGLSLVRGLVQLHGGTVSARSDGPGHGSEFIVQLPLAERASSDDVREHTTAMDRVRHRVLVVDDNTDSADTLAALLEIMGAETATAYSGEQALATAETFRPSAALLDIGMPGTNGFDVCRRLRAQPWARDVVMIAMTGWGQDDDRRQTREAGFDHHMVKPVDVSALTKLLGEPRS